MNLQPLDDHLHPESPHAVAKRAQDGAQDRCEAIMIAVGQYAPAPETSVRVLVLGRTPKGNETLADAWMIPRDTRELMALLRESAPRQGRCDAMYLTPWTCAWTTDDEPMEVWDEGGRLLWHFDGRLYLRAINNCVTVREIHGFVSPDWTRRGVALALADGSTQQLIAIDEPMATLDPTYDRLDLVCDAAWVSDLAHAMARRLGAAIRIDPALA
ncbi:MAG: hypothetical protein EB084_21500 [Proteobacteria bacterium]|nr:hypothetical protein [Pseudomonadota bacterium]